MEVETIELFFQKEVMFLCIYIFYMKEKLLLLFNQSKQHIQFQQQHPLANEPLEQHYERVDVQRRTNKLLINGGSSVK